MQNNNNEINDINIINTDKINLEQDENNIINTDKINLGQDDNNIINTDIEKLELQGKFNYDDYFVHSKKYRLKNALKHNQALNDMKNSLFDSSQFLKGEDYDEVNNSPKFDPRKHNEEIHEDLKNNKISKELKDIEKESIISEETIQLDKDFDFNRYSEAVNQYNNQYTQFINEFEQKENERIEKVNALEKEYGEYITKNLKNNLRNETHAYGLQTNRFMLDNNFVLEICQNIIDKEIDKKGFANEKLTREEIKDKFITVGTLLDKIVYDYNRDNATLDKRNIKGMIIVCDKDILRSGYSRQALEQKVSRYEAKFAAKGLEGAMTDGYATQNDIDRASQCKIKNINAFADQKLSRFPQFDDLSSKGHQFYQLSRHIQVSNNQMVDGERNVEQVFASMDHKYKILEAMSKDAVCSAVNALDVMQKSLDNTKGFNKFFQIFSYWGMKSRVNKIKNSLISYGFDGNKIEQFLSTDPETNQRRLSRQELIQDMLKYHNNLEKAAKEDYEKLKKAFGLDSASKNSYDKEKALDDLNKDAKKEASKFLSLNKVASNYLEQRKTDARKKLIENLEELSQISNVPEEHLEGIQKKLSEKEKIFNALNNLIEQNKNSENKKEKTISEYANELSQKENPDQNLVQGLLALDNNLNIDLVKNQVGLEVEGLKDLHNELNCIMKAKMPITSSLESLKKKAISPAETKRLENDQKIERYRELMERGRLTPGEASEINNIKQDKELKNRVEKVDYELNKQKLEFNEKAIRYNELSNKENLNEAETKELNEMSADENFVKRAQRIDVNAASKKIESYNKRISDYETNQAKHIKKEQDAKIAHFQSKIIKNMVNVKKESAYYLKGTENYKNKFNLANQLAKESLNSTMEEFTNEVQKYKDSFNKMNNIKEDFISKGVTPKALLRDENGNFNKNWEQFLQDNDGETITVQVSDIDIDDNNIEENVQDINEKSVQYHEVQYTIDADEDIKNIKSFLSECSKVVKASKDFNKTTSQGLYDISEIDEELEDEEELQNNVELQEKVKSSTDINLSDPNATINTSQVNKERTYEK